MRRLLLVAPVLALATLPAEAADHGVDVADDSFSPASRAIAPGDTVTWTNRGQKLHSVTGDGFNRNLLPGGTFDWTFPTAGTFAYRCNFHGSSGMRGTIVVQAAAAPDEADAGTSTSINRPAAPDDTDEPDESDPSDAGPAAVAALLLAAVSGAAALAVKRGL